MNDSSTRVGGMIWAGYALLLLFSFSLYWSLLLWAGLAGLSVVAGRAAGGRPLSAADRLPFGVFLAIGGWLTWSLGPLSG